MRHPFRALAWIALLALPAHPAPGDEAVPVPEPVAYPAPPPAPEALPATPVGDAGMATPAGRAPTSTPAPEEAAARAVGIPDRTEPAAVRGPTSCPAQIFALAPAHGVGTTRSAAPTLYWHLPEPTDCRVEFVLNDPRTATPRVEHAVPGPHAAGVHALALAGLGIELEPGVVYTWYIQLVPDADARSQDVFSGGPIERITAGDAGWYDVLAAHQEALRTRPDDAATRDVVARLLDAEGLVAVTGSRAPATPHVAAGIPDTLGEP